MAKKKKGKKKEGETILHKVARIGRDAETGEESKTRKIIKVLILIFLGIFFILAYAGVAGVVGDFIHTKVIYKLLGMGSIILPLMLFVYVFYSLRPGGETKLPEKIALPALAIAILGILGIIGAYSETHSAGIIGDWIGGLFLKWFEVYVGTIILGLLALIALIVLTHPYWNLFTPLFQRRDKGELHVEDYTEEDGEDEEESEEDEEEDEEPALKIAEKKQEVVGEDIVMKMDTAFLNDKDYVFPPLALLNKTTGKPTVGDIKANAVQIQRTLRNFGIDVEMDEVTIGPTVARYALKPAEGVKLSRIVGLQNDLALALAAKSIRIEAPIPGKSLVGIEVPNQTKSTIGLGSLLSESEFQKANFPLTVALGKGVSGKSYFANLAKMPHLLIAGATGSGKSVTVHNFITSLLYRNSPDALRFILVDPKRVELTQYNKIPHLLTPVITDPKKAILALKWLIKEMERRYDVLESESVRDIASYHASIVSPAYEAFKKNGRAENSPSLPERMPYVVVIIDELADLMSTYPRELEAAIVRLAQMSRAVGIHLILSTQRPSVNVITGLIKANIPTRVALKVASQVDSRTILDRSGAEKLLGAGDMLYMSADMPDPERLQCAYVSENEVKNIVKFIRKNNGDDIVDEITLPDKIDEENGGGGEMGGFDDDDDPLFDEAKEIVISSKKASTSYLQRKLRIGYSRAARLIDILEERGIVGPADGAKPREIIGANLAEERAEYASEEASYGNSEFLNEEDDEDEKEHE